MSDWQFWVLLGVVVFFGLIICRILDNHEKSLSVLLYRARNLGQ